MLDVATGRGAALFPAAEKVGPSGQVTGIDYPRAW
ncbi:MAG: methyltransferase domain-containing protein [Chloroflexia bacterium]